MNESRGIEGTSAEIIPQPKFKLMITRHAERVPSGELSPEGVESAKRKGEKAKKGGAEVLKAYVSDHPSGRAYDTGELISSASDIRSGRSGKQYRTHKVPDIQYDILKPDLYQLIAEAKDYIEVATLKELGWSTERNEKGKLKIDIEKLPKEKQIEIAPVRQKYQPLAFEYILDKNEAVHRMAMGLAHQLERELGILKEYTARRKDALNSPKGDVVLNNVSHGLFTESLLMEAGVYVDSNGKETDGIKDFTGSEFGGYVMPAESLSLVFDDPSALPDRIPVEFEKAGRVPNGKVFIDRNKLETLARQYKEWKKSLPKGDKKAE